MEAMSHTTAGMSETDQVITIEIRAGSTYEANKNNKNFTFKQDINDTMNTNVTFERRIKPFWHTSCVTRV